MGDNSVSINFSGLFMGLLGIIFVTAKLWGVINWSWWLVLGPFWMPAACGILFILCWLLFIGMIFLVGFVLSLFEGRRV